MSLLALSKQLVQHSDLPGSAPQVLDPPLQHGMDYIWALLVSGANTEVILTKSTGERVTYRLESAAC